MIVNAPQEGACYWGDDLSPTKNLGSIQYSYFCLLIAIMPLAQRSFMSESIRPQEVDILYIAKTTTNQNKKLRHDRNSNSAYLRCIESLTCYQRSKLRHTTVAFDNYSILYRYIFFWVNC